LKIVKLDLKFNFTYIPKCPWWTSRNRFWKNSNKIYNLMFFMHSQILWKIIKNYQFFLIFQSLLICYCQYHATQQKSESKIPKRSFDFDFFMWIKLMSQIIVRSHFFELLLQFIDDFVVFEVRSFNNSEIRFVIWFFRHSQNDLEGLPVSFEKCQKDC
jgi:hypothetical protein